MEVFSVGRATVYRTLNRAAGTRPAPADAGAGAALTASGNTPA